jgi:3-keto-L-gulonate-6-phosphate decarboxylase
METDAAKTGYQPNSEILPLIEMARSENQRLHIELGNFAGEKESLKQDLVEVRSHLAAEHASRDENKKSAPVEKDLPNAADLLNKLKANGKNRKPTWLT